MKKLLLALAVVVLVGALYGLSHYISKDTEETGLVEDYKKVTFMVSGTPVSLIGGVAKVQTSLGGASETTVRYFGNELSHDVDGDGQADMVFLITQETGGSGTFYYLVGALKRDTGYVGTNAVLIGDRIAPQTTQKGEGRQVIVNYADRAPGEPMVAQPSIGKSLHLQLDTKSLDFGEVVQNFEGESR